MLMCRYTAPKGCPEFAGRVGVHIADGQWSAVPESFKVQNDAIRANGWKESADRFEFRNATPAEFAQHMGAGLI